MNAASTAPPDPREPAGRFEWERIVRRVVMPARAKFLAFVLASYADQDGSRVRPGVDVLAAVTGQGTSTVRRLLRELRDDHGLIEQTRRGGGRNGNGRTAEYRLTIPADLLDRVEMLTPAERAPRLSAHLASAQTGQSPVDNSDTALTQESAQTCLSPVDNSDTALTQESAQTCLSPVDNSPMSAHPDERSNVNGNDFHRSIQTGSERLTARSERLTARSADQLSLRPTTQDHPTTPDPAQPPTARADRSQKDHAESSDKTAAAPPDKCDHGLTRHRHGDGQPTCPLCRRGVARSPT